MSRIVDTDQTFNDIEPRNYIVEPLPKPVDKRGYMYIVIDSTFPDFIKIGKTSDMQKRLTSYNSDRPVKTVSLYMISELFDDVSYVELKILDHLYNVTEPTTFRREWFKIEHKDLMIELINKAEAHFSLPG